MASSSETGHAINVANFEDLISFCTGYGPSYNPTNPRIQIPNMQNLRLACANSITAVNNVLTPHTTAINARQLSFEPLQEICRRAVYFLASSGTDKKVIDDAKTILRKILGDRKSKPTPTPRDEAGTSASQQSFDSRISNFAKLIDLLSGVPQYTPNEFDLQLAQLSALLNNLQAANTAVINALTPLSNARIARNNLLYAETVGLVDVAQQCKKYIRSVFGVSSPQYRQVSGIKFTKRKI